MSLGIENQSGRRNVVVEVLCVFVSENMSECVQTVLYVCYNEASLEEEGGAQEVSERREVR